MSLPFHIKALTNDDVPRYFPPVLEEFAKAGIIEDIIAAGEKVVDGCDWRNADGDLLAGIDPPPNDPTFAVCLSQPELGEILRKRILETGYAEIIWNESFQRLKQVDGSVAYWTKNKLKDQETERICRYLVGADGGRSAVRKNLGIHLEGYTFEGFQFVAVNFQYPLSAMGWKAANFIVDPVDWGVVVKRGKGTSWRFATGVKKSAAQQPTSVDEATVQLVKDRLRRILPGDTSEIQYEAMAPYIVHQRCATRFQDGNVLLAGDAAHVSLIILFFSFSFFEKFGSLLITSSLIAQQSCWWSGTYYRSARCCPFGACFRKGNNTRSQSKSSYILRPNKAADFPGTNQPGEYQ